MSASPIEINKNCTCLHQGWIFAYKLQTVPLWMEKVLTFCEHKLGVSSVGFYFSMITS